MTFLQITVLKITLLVGLLVCRCPVFSQAYHFTQADMKEAAPGSFLYKAFEDSKGYIWLLSYKSVIRFDGKRYKVFGPDEGYHETGAYRIFEDRDGVIWLLTVNFKLYYFKDNVFRQIPQKPLINLICQDEKGNKWAFDRDNSITYRIGSNNILHPVYSYPQYGSCYSAYIINDSTHLVYLTFGIFLWSGGKLQRITNSSMYKHHLPSRFFKIRDKLLVTNEVGIYEWKQNRLNLLAALDDTTEVFDMVYDSLQDHIWVTTSKGMMRYDHDITRQSRPEWYLKEKTGLSITQMRDGNFWITTANSGTYVFNSNVFHITQQQGLRDEDIRHIEKESGNIYFFARYTPYYRFRNHTTEQFQFPHPKERGEWIKAPGRICALSDTSIVVFSTRSVIISKGKSRIHEYLAKEVPIRYLSNNGHFTTYDWRMYANGKPIIDSLQMKSMYEAMAARKISMQTIQQAGCFDGDTLYLSAESGVLRCYWVGKHCEATLLNMPGMISYITMYGRSLIVCTRTHGVYVYTNGSLVNYNDQNGLLSNHCSTLVIRNGVMWVCTTKGLTRISLEKGTIRNYTTKDYLIDNEVNDVDFLGDTIFVGTAKGVSYFRVDREIPVKKPLVLIEKVLVNNTLVAVSDNYELRYEENNISLTLCSPGYRSADFNRYRVIVEHDGKQDTTVYKDGLIQLLALMPGNYRIRVSVMNMDGLWNSDPQTISITVNPPFWRAWWFIFIVGLVSLNAIGYIVWLSVKRQKDAQEYNRKIVESELRSLRLYMNPHFLFNSLASLQAFVLTRKNEEANTFITKFSKLIRSVMTYSIRGELRLSEEIALLNSYLELECIRFNNEFTFEVTAEESIAADEITIPSLIIQPFVENAIKHGVTGTGRKCYISVQFFMRHGDLFCRVEDNGKGRTEKSVKDTDHISSGVSFTVERIRLLVQKKMDDVISFRDTNAGHPMRGTTVEVLVPILDKEG